MLKTSIRLRAGNFGSNLFVVVVSCLILPPLIKLIVINSTIVRIPLDYVLEHAIPNSVLRKHENHYVFLDNE